MPNNQILYLMGSGRSGTTFLSALLGAHASITNRGELIHLYNESGEKQLCSCGLELSQCSELNRIKTIFSTSDTRKTLINARRLERHRMVPVILFRLTRSAYISNYKKLQEKVFGLLNKTNTKYVLDSSKFVSRAMLLRQIFGRRVKVVFLVRDARGVIYSFDKPVQSSRSFLSAILYYNLVNVAAFLASKTVLSRCVITVRYEDFLKNPQAVLERIGEHINVDMTQLCEAVEKGEEFDTGHIIGGNRIKSKKSMKIKADVEWKRSMSWSKRLVAYFLCFPILLLHRYRP